MLQSGVIQPRNGYRSTERWKCRCTEKPKRGAKRKTESPRLKDHAAEMAAPNGNVEDATNTKNIQSAAACQTCQMSDLSQRLQKSARQPYHRRREHDRSNLSANSTVVQQNFNNIPAELYHIRENSTILSRNQIVLSCRRNGLKEVQLHRGKAPQFLKISKEEGGGHHSRITLENESLLSVSDARTPYV